MQRDVSLAALVGEDTMNFGEVVRVYPLASRRTGGGGLRQCEIICLATNYAT